MQAQTHLSKDKLKQLIRDSLECDPYFHDDSTIVVERSREEILFLRLNRTKLNKNSRGAYRIDFLVSMYNLETNQVKRGFFRIYFDDDKILWSNLKIY